MSMTKRKRVVKDFLKLARKIQKRDSWFIGRFLGAVEEEWEQQEKNHRAKVAEAERLCRQVE